MLLRIEILTYSAVFTGNYSGRKFNEFLLIFFKHT